MKFYCILAASFVALFFESNAQNITLIPQGNSWKYLSDGSDQGISWQSALFNDVSWPVGNAQLGYGDGDESTVISYGPNSLNKYITYYFRKSFTVTNASAYASLQLNLLRDDGAVVYLNGTEVVRSNMPAGSITYLTTASAIVSGTGESTFYPFSIPVALLQSGTNVLSVEVHQNSASNPDVSFDLSLEAVPVIGCSTPVNLQALQVNTYSATLGWNQSPAALGYQVRYRKAGTTGWSTVPAITNSVSLVALGASKTYEYQVQADCAGGSSPFSVSSFFTTLPLCIIPSSPLSSSVSSSSATLSWSPVVGAVGYKLQYRKAGVTTWKSINSSVNSATITALQSGTPYEWRVKTICGANSSNYTAIANFTTLVSCGNPSGLIAASITGSSASVTWNQVPGAISYLLNYRIQGTVSWSSLNTTLPLAVINGLTPANVYEVRVQATCSGGNSPFSLIYNFSTLASGTDTLIVTNAMDWKYLDNGSNQGSAWKSPVFNDGSWPSGQAELGYGDGDEKKIIGYGPDPNNKFVTSYFRKTFMVNNPLAYTSLRMGIVRDDGIIVYLNGTEVYRNNMPSVNINYNTLAVVNILNAEESAWHTIALDPSLLQPGANVIAVEVHQQFLSSADLSFNCRLYASGPALPLLITRGPYLQKLTPGSITIRWRTDIETGSRVRFGTSTAYTGQVNNQDVSTEHVVEVNGLSPATKYFYSVGTSFTDLQGDSNNTFVTSPVSGSILPVRIWATGDFGNGSTSQANVRNAYMNYPGALNTNLWIWLGDNAYSTGTDLEYQNFVFDMYPAQMKRFPLYPGIGNHDYGNAGYQTAGTLGTGFPYFSIFSIPFSGEAGGLASGTPKYYSYNYSNIHFISLDSYGSYNNAGSPMYTWLSNDLASNNQRWTIVYFHHPPYTQGTHNSDTETELIAMRGNIIPLLESHGVDLVLCGHSHVNERSYLLKGHYGLYNTFNPSMKISTATNTFLKVPPYDGTIYAVCGTSGQNPGTVQPGYPMPCMYFSNNSNNCSLVLDVNGDNLSCIFLSSTGVVADQVNITKTGSMAPAQENKKGLNAFYNPSNSTIELQYFLEEGGRVRFEIENSSGTKANQKSCWTYEQASGYHNIQIPYNGEMFSAGIYFIRMMTTRNCRTAKLLMVR